MRRVLAVLACVVLVGCGSRQPSSFDARADINKLMFVKHPSGLCFGVLYSVAYGGHMVRTITNIPCQSGDTVYVK